MPHSISAPRFLGALLLLSTILPNLHAQAPTTVRIEVRSFAPGKQSHLVAHGKGLTNARHLWTPHGVIPINAIDEKPSDTVAHFEGPLPADISPGVCETRVITAQGVSSRRFLVIDDLATYAPPDSCEADPPTTVLPGVCSLNGYMNALKPKFFSLALSKGQSVSVEVFARRLDSPLDPVLRFSTAAGRELAFEDDTPGLAGDAQLSVTAPEDGTYVLELRDVQYSGGGSHYYHLRIGAFPLVQGTFPRRTTAGSEVQLISATSEDVATIVPAKALPLFSAVAITTPHGSGLSSLSTGTTAPLLEAEPNDTRETATSVSADTVAVAGRFHAMNDSDWFKISFSEPGHLCVTTHTRDVGSPSDVVLELWDVAGKKLQESDDAGTNDARLSLAVAAAGEYFVHVRELSGQGGASWTYDLELSRHGRVEATTAVDTVAVPQNGTAIIPVSVARYGDSAPFEITATDLPAGVESTPVIVTAKQKTAYISLHATDKAPASWQQRLSLQARPTAPAAAIPILYAPPAAKGISYNLPRLQTGVFAHAAAAAAFSLRTDSADLTVTAGSETQFTISAVRTGDWTQPIEVTTAVPAAELPTGITVAAAKIEKDSASLTIKADGKVAPGRYSLSLQGTLKKDKTTIVQPLPTITLTVTKGES